MTPRSCSTSRPKKSSRLSSAVAAALFLELVAAPARAAGGDFAPHVQQAQTCYDAKDFDCAVRELQAAYDIKHLPGLLLNIGHAHLDAGRPQEALTFYGMYLQSEKKLTPAIRAEVEKFRAQARERMKAGVPQPPNPNSNPNPNPNPAAEPTPNPAVSPGPSPNPEPPPPTAAPEPPIVVPVTPAPAPIEPSKAPRSTLPPRGALALIGIGTGLTLIGVILGAEAIGTARQVTSGAGPFDADLDSRGRPLSYAGATLDVLGVLALAGGLGWTFAWVAGRNKEKAPAAATISVRPSAAGAVVLGRF